MISLGRYDPDISESAIESYLALIEKFDRNVAGKKLIGDKGPVALKPLAKGAAISVGGAQTLLRDLGFLPGSRIDGICGYRTQASIRLFQEYVRSIEGKRCLPDGILGPATLAHLERWRNEGTVAGWSSTLDAWEDGSLSRKDCEYNRWLEFLGTVKAQYLAHPSPMLELVNAYRRPSDTFKVADWDFSPGDVHVVGIRYGATRTTHKFDDVLVLLIRGLCFKFQASTDPGYTRNPKGAPFLVQGQHLFQFGLHRGSYHALRPARHGVLVVRSRGDYRLTEEDLDNGLEANTTINIHWGGKGVGRAVNRWSEGCQIIAGSGYRNHNAAIVDCSDHAGLNNTEVKRKSVKKTRAAYNVLSDLINALSSGIEPVGQVKYTLLLEDDLKLSPEIASEVQRSRSLARRLYRF
jgi:hypothetical protein